MKENEIIKYEGCLFEIDAGGRIWRMAMLRNKEIIPLRKRRGESLMPQGYLRFGITIDGRPLRTMAHRLVWIKSNGSIPSDKEINHKDGDKTNNDPSNLECITPKENIQHSLNELKVLRARGSRNGVSKLTEAQVKEMRYLWPQQSYQELAEKYHVNKWTIRRILKRKSWKHI